MANNSRHLKRHSMPVSWPIKRKNINFITKPKAGSHKLGYVVPVVVLLRDVLGYAKTLKEAKLIVYTGDVLVNGKKITDVKYPCGIFDTFEIKESKEKYTIIFNELGKVKLVPSKDDLIYLKVSGKTLLSGKKFQINFMNGFNIVVDEKTAKGIKVNDSIVYDFTKKKVMNVLPFKEGSFVYIFDGKFKGQFGEIKSLTAYHGLSRDIALLNVKKKEHSTAKDYCFTIGSSAADLKRFE
ncbi:MAG: 30S ribosomal protein S4e [Nanoarchaeota archaeon]|nr:30S ribosomal protein S4e [Nanoarchaeota archaeon]